MYDIFAQPSGYTGNVVNLEGTLMEHDLPIVDFKFSDGKLVHMKEYPENADSYYDLWTPGCLTEQDLQAFLSYRVPVWHRPSVKRMLRQLGVIPGNVDQYLHVAHGVWSDDHFWIRFPDDTDICWDMVKLRD